MVTGWQMAELGVASTAAAEQQPLAGPVLVGRPSVAVLVPAGRT